MTMEENEFDGEVWDTGEAKAIAMEMQFMPAALVSSGDNMMAAAWLSQVSVDPPLFMVSLRKERYTYEKVQETGEIAINMMPIEHADKVHFCGTRSGRKVDKFAETGLTRRKPVMTSSVLVEQAIAIYECRVVNEVEAGDHQLIVAEVVFVHRKKGVDLTDVRPALYVGSGYYTTVMRPYKF